MYPNVTDELPLRNRKHVFRDRIQAAEMMVDKLSCYNASETCVLAIPSGGIPIAYTVSERLGFPMSLVLVRKIPVPWNPEAGFGAIAADGATVLNDDLVRTLGLSEEEIATLASRVMSIIRNRAKKFHSVAPSVSLKNKTLILTDDGLASGYTMLAAIKSARKCQPKKLVVAVPTASTAALRVVAPLADRVVCLNVRDETVYAVADAYQNWHDLSDEEVLSYLRRIGRHVTHKS